VLQDVRKRLKRTHTSTSSLLIVCHRQNCKGSVSL
jgi:hypothetical protein